MVSAWPILLPPFGGGGQFSSDIWGQFITANDTPTPFIGREYDQIVAPSAYLGMLQRSENTQLLTEGTQRFGCRAFIEVVPGGELKKGDAPGDAQSQLVPQEVDAADYALQVFKGTLLFP